VVSHLTRFFNFYPSHIFVIGEANHFTFRVLIDKEEYIRVHVCVQSHVTSLNFGKYVIVCGLSNGTIANDLE